MLLMRCEDRILLSLIIIYISYVLYKKYLLIFSIHRGEIRILKMLKHITLVALQRIPFYVKPIKQSKNTNNTEGPPKIK